MKSYLILLLTLLIFGCNHSANTQYPSITDSIEKKIDTPMQSRIFDEDWEEKGNRLRDTNYQYLDRILAKVLKAATEHKNDKFFNGTIDTGVYHFKNMRATFEFGNIFSTNKKHLLVKRFISEYGGYATSLFSDIYILKGNRFVKQVSDTADIGYSDDALEDINFDGVNDFIVSQYSGAGCCPRDDRVAYLYNDKNNNFETVGFFNPEFDDENKLVYEMDYGHPGEISITKNRWDGVKKVEVESISPTHVENRIDSFVMPYSYTKIIYPSERQVIIKSVPDEYKKLKSFEYFISYQE